MTAFLAFVISAALLPPTFLFFRRIRCLDVPNHRSAHQEATPRGGGIALVVGGIAAIVLGADLLFMAAWPYAALVALYGGVGLLDDIRHGISAFVRLAACFFGAVLIVPWAVIVIEGRSILFGLASVAFIVAFTNSFNFMDGINGISAVHMVAYGIILAYLGAGPDGFPVSREIGLALIGCGLAFLPFNAVCPRVFMGDAGTYAIGGAASFAAVGLAASGRPISAVLAVFLPYIMDTGLTVVRRARQHKRWWEAHREHAYQNLVECGMSHTAVAIAVGAVSLGCGALGVVALGSGRGAKILLSCVALVMAATYAIIPHTLATQLRGRSESDEADDVA